MKLISIPLCNDKGNVIVNAAHITAIVPRFNDMGETYWTVNRSEGEWVFSELHLVCGACFKVDAVADQILAKVTHEYAAVTV